MRTSQVADVFQLINNALLDLQQGDYNTFQRPLKTLGRLLDTPELAEVNAKLTANVDYAAFAESGVGAGTMGGERLVWPDDPAENLGVVVLLIRKLAADPEEAIGFCHQHFGRGNTMVSGIHGFVRQVLVPFVRDYKQYVQSQGEPEVTMTRPGSNKVFVVHGHDEGALQALARFIEKLGLEPIVLKERPNQGRTIIEKFEDSARDVGFAIVLLTPDDQASAGGTDSQRARQNVVFELGFFAGALGRGRVCLLRKGDVEMPSDLFGVIYTEMDVAGAGGRSW
jgi:hypothetical protein